MADEYLVVSQVAWLLNEKKYGIDQLIRRGQLKCVMRQGRRLILASELKRYVTEKKEKYIKADEYFMAENKSSFWILQHVTFNNRNLFHDHSMVEYLTVTQVAYLLNMSRQGVHGLVERGKIYGRYVESKGRENRIILIRADDLERYVTEKKKKYIKADEYFMAADKKYFWQSNMDYIESDYIKPTKERNRRYYERKKVQKRADQGRPGR